MKTIKKSKVATKPKKVEHVRKDAAVDNPLRNGFVSKYLRIATHHLRLRCASEAINRQFDEIDSAMNALRRCGVVTTELVDRLAGLGDAFSSMLERLNMLCMKQRKEAIDSLSIQNTLDVQKDEENGD